MVRRKIQTEQAIPSNKNLSNYRNKIFFGDLTQQGFKTAEDEELTKRTFSKTFRLIGGGDAHQKIHNTGVVSLG